MTLLKKYLLRFLLFVIFIAALLASSDNSEPTRLTFLGYQTPEWPIAWWVLAAFVLGVLFGAILNAWSNTRLRLKTRKANRALAESHEEIDRARAASTSTSGMPSQLLPGESHPEPEHRGS